MIIDRFENDSAVIETDGGFIDIPRSCLPENAREGDVIIPDGSGYVTDVEQTEKRREEIREKMKRLMKK